MPDEYGNMFYADYHEDARYKALRGLDMGPAKRKVEETPKPGPSCPTHDVGLHYVHAEDKWVCPVKKCSTTAMRNKARPPKAPKRTKTLMEVFHDDDQMREAFSPINHEVRPTALGLHIEYDKVRDEERYYLFDLPLKMQVDVTDYVEQVIDPERNTVSLVLSLSRVTRT